MNEADLERMDELRPKVPKFETISEAEEQEAVITWRNYNQRKHPCLKFLYHTPNGGSRNIAEAVHLKRMGVVAGVPDLFLPFNNGRYAGLWIEMKTEKGRPTACQKEWIEWLNSQGYMALVCHGASEAIDVIWKYLTENVKEYDMLESENRKQGVYVHDSTRA